MSDSNNAAPKLCLTKLENDSKPEMLKEDLKSAYERKLLKQQIDASINDLTVPLVSMADTEAITKLLKCIKRIECLLNGGECCGAGRLQKEVLKRLVELMPLKAQLQLEFQTVAHLKIFAKEMLIDSITHEAEAVRQDFETLE